MGFLFVHHHEKTCFLVLDIKFTVMIIKVGANSAHQDLTAPLGAGAVRSGFHCLQHQLHLLVKVLKCLQQSCRKVFNKTVKPVLSEHINLDMFLAFQTSGCLLLHERSFMH